MWAKSTLVMSSNISDISEYPVKRPGPAKRRLPLVAICGRPNVGKSSLFNRITGRPSAIVDSVEGITRDRAYAQAQWRDRQFKVVDTGGLVEQPIDSVLRKMQHQIRLALDEADVIVFVVDGRQEITRTDHEMCRALFKLGKPVVLAVNKLDNEALAANHVEFYRLGLGDPIPISCAHGLGMDALLDEVTGRLPAAGDMVTDRRQGQDDLEPSATENMTQVAVVGKPNVGKSSFINAILQEERTIVDEKPGTTRDALDIEFSWRNNRYLFIDTAGMRKKGRIKENLERYSISRALRAVRRADVCLVLLESTAGITEQDKRILEYIRENGPGIVIAWTKWDLVEDKRARLDKLKDELDFKAPFLRFVPKLTISSVTRKRLFTTFDYIDRVAVEAQKRISTGELNRFIKELGTQNLPATHKGDQAKILYATQADIKPTTFVLFVNHKRLFHFSYTRFIENRLREKYGFEGVPIHIELREDKPVQNKARRRQ